ncbi:MAG: molybdopterin molybdotransferase MoeA [Alphaproteobacteria bacterium]|nr:molybdopterin molybdotransferase MoeA [Alphaproteobacteria bacterium]MBU0793111.1 molybdopterin molybdotransferase MoeA [Alphaproteobacteria bacterium]MBU0876909.1 molybdopterin molybdotransferase MoeA [Alphaproteobacteria bacterium]MBU1771113.1 molybdopterin molybdotransferase MoeA [Alphaproteobacteria bacterium]
MISVAEAQDRLLALAKPLPPQTVSLVEANGRWLTEPVAAQRDQPWTALSAMDGYAIRHADLPGPWRLTGESAAGSVPPTSLLGQGEAMRIFTGAPLPPGADTVMVQEDVSADGVEIHLTGDGPGDTGKHVRARASDFAQGDVLLAAGTRIGPAQIGLAALAGHAALPVHRQPRVTILSTGDELVPPGAPCPPGKLPASNGAMLSAMVEGAGGLVIAEQIVRDDLAALTDALRDARTADIIVTSGGASVGDHDLVRPALEAAGGTIDFWRIAMQPGKPLIVARIGQQIVLGLPGNPVSAMVTGALFLLPLIRRLAGAQDVLPKPQRARLGADVPPVGKRTLFMRAVLGDDGIATPLAFQDSGAMQAAAQANALIVRPAGAPAGQAGDETQLLHWAALGLGHA